MGGAHGGMAGTVGGRTAVGASMRLPLTWRKILVWRSRCAALHCRGGGAANGNA